jgi:hypothetical protein
MKDVHADCGGTSPDDVEAAEVRLEPLLDQAETRDLGKAIDRHGRSLDTRFG